MAKAAFAGTWQAVPSAALPVARPALTFTLHGRFHPQFRDQNRRDIAKSQCKWTAQQMETPGVHLAPALARDAIVVPVARLRGAAEVGLGRVARVADAELALAEAAPPGHGPLLVARRAPTCPGVVSISSIS
eukprot:COSAG01_NODE_240_length_20656_cov_53.398259_24_plen_132_part_00